MSLLERLPRLPGRPRLVPALVALSGLCGAGVVLLAGAMPAGAATHAPTAGDPVAGAVYLAGQLKPDHIVFAFDGTTPDYGSTVDTVVALAAAQVGANTITAVMNYLDDPAVVSDYANPADVTFGGPYPGSYAKLALAAEITGRDPHAFGGTDLIAQLTALQCPVLDTATPGACAAWEVGEFKSGNLANGAGFPGVVAQTYDVLATMRAGETVVATAGSAFLAAQQCADGSFANTFADNTVQCASGGDVDATAAAVQALVAAPGVTQNAAVAAAIAWLQTQQQSDGSYVNAQPPSIANVNSTALAANALQLANQSAAAPLAYLAAQQFSCGSAPANLGAFKFAGAADVRATNQAIVALTGASLLTVTVTSTGAAATVPTLACPTVVTTAPTSARPAATSSAPAVVVTTATPSRSASSAIAAGGESLPATGTDVQHEVWLGLAAVLMIGAGLFLVISQRPGRRRAR
jgi:hypothetical protein